MGNLDLRVKGKYRLQLRLGGGSFGEVYKGRDLDTAQEVAMKLEHVRIDPSHLENEIDIYRELAGGPGIPRMYWHGHECEFRVMVFELLGPNLEDLFNYCGRKFSLKTVLMLADQLIHRFQYIHSKGYTHRDVKPENLLMGVGRQGNKVYVADFGSAEEICEPMVGHREAWRCNRLWIGTPRYASITAHLNSDLVPGDDMESLGYVLIYLLRGSLPWQGLEADSEEQKDELILKKKQSTTVQELYEGLPEEFKKYFTHVRSLRSDEAPNYAYLRRLFGNLFRRERYEYDHVFDWTVLKYIEYLEGCGKATEDS